MVKLTKALDLLLEGILCTTGLFTDISSAYRIAGGQ